MRQKFSNFGDFQNFSYFNHSAAVFSFLCFLFLWIFFHSFLHLLHVLKLSSIKYHEMRYQNPMGRSCGNIQKIIEKWSFKSRSGQVSYKILPLFVKAKLLYWFNKISFWHHILHQAFDNLHLTFWWIALNRASPLPIYIAPKFIWFLPLIFFIRLQELNNNNIFFLFIKSVCKFIHNNLKI